LSFNTPKPTRGLDALSDSTSDPHNSTRREE
jgi:hypothetical protein